MQNYIVRTRFKFSNKIAWISYLYLRPDPRLDWVCRGPSSVTLQPLIACKFVFNLCNCQKCQNIFQYHSECSKRSKSDMFWKFSKLSFPATFAQQAKTRKYLQKESRNLLVEISAFHAGMNWMIDLISDWLVWMFRQTLDDLSAMSSRNRSAEGERANAAATSGAPSLEGSFKTQNILPFLTIFTGYLRQRFILK